MLIALLNESTRLKDAAQVAAIAEACDLQLRRHAYPVWDRRVTRMKAFTDTAAVPAGAFPLVLLDNADQAGALGYHDVTPTGQPYGRIFVGTVLDNGGTILRGALSVSAVTSHESLEAFGDLLCNAWADAGSKSYAYELCDPVESDFYDVRTKAGLVAVSNFVLPEWFSPNPPAGAKFDYLGKLKAPFTMSKGGYVISMQDGKVSETFGDEVPAWRRASKEFPAARSARRRDGRQIDFEPTPIGEGQEATVAEHEPKKQHAHTAAHPKAEGAEPELASEPIAPDSVTPYIPLEQSPGE